jgi:hypothetical protein
LSGEITNLSGPTQGRSSENPYSLERLIVGGRTTVVLHGRRQAGIRKMPKKGTPK